MPATDRKPRKLKRETWFQVKGEEAAKCAWTFATALHTKQGRDRRDWADDCLALYEGNAARELGLVAATVWGVDPATFNAVGACVDTRASHVFRNKVRPFFLTQRGNPAERQKAQGMQMAVEGTFHEAKIYGELGQHICWDGETFEAGCCKVVPDYANSRVLLERLRAQDVYFDRRDAMLGKPTQCVVYQTVDRAKLLDFCKDAKPEVIEAILEANPAPAEMYEDDELGETETCDRIRVAELWHLPSGKVNRDDDAAWEVGKVHDGRHMIVLGDDKHQIALHDEAWPFDYFPIAFYRPKKRRRGFWSQSIPERLVGAQLAINRMLRRVDGIMNLHARPLVYVNTDARVNTDKITNSWASIIEGKGPAANAIQYITPQSVPAEYLGQIQQIIQWCFQQEGISELAATSSVPDQEESGVARQMRFDSESIRHTDVFRAWEDFHVDLARMVVDAFRLLAENDNAALKIQWGNSKELKEIDWREVDLTESKYQLMVWPTNLLPQTPSARLQRVIELMREKLITPQQGLMLLEFPDIEAITGDGNAALRNIMNKLDALSRGDDGLKAMPHEYMQLDVALQLALDRLNHLEAEDTPEETLDAIRQWIEDVKELRDAAQPPPAPAAAPPVAPGAPPPAAPPPPVPPALPVAA
jgi:hypothetical protein